MKNLLRGLMGVAALSMSLPALAQTQADPSTVDDTALVDGDAMATLPDTELAAGQTAADAAAPETAGAISEMSAPVDTTADTPADAAVDAGEAPDDAGAPLATIPVGNDAPPPVVADDAAGPSRVMAEIVVTAQKREQNLQDVPISISAFSGDELEARGINDPTALAMVTPGLTYNNLVGYSLVYIRGVGSDAFEPTADQSVATYIDGVYLPFAHGLAQEFVKLERVEVLKGPQGTLFGRNATGGAINIVTKKPTDAYEANIDLTGGSFNDREGKFFVAGPLFGGLRASVSGLYKRSDSYYKLADDARLDELDQDKSRGLDVHLEWQPVDELSFMASTLLTRSSGPGSIVNTVENPKLLGTLVGIRSAAPGEASIDYNPSLKADNDLYYGQIAWMPEWFDVKLLGSHQIVHTDLTYDFDSSKQPLVYFHASNQYSKVTSGELQLLSKPGGIFPDWMELTAGLYYFKSDAGYDPVIFGVGSGSNPLFLPPGLMRALNGVLALLPPWLPLPTSGVQLTLFSTLKTEAEAAYLQTTFYPTDWFDITLGARVQHEKRGTTRADSTLTTSAGPLTLLPFGLESTTRNDFSPKLTLDFKPWDGQLFYITASRASKSGTYNMPAIYTKPRYVKPETVTAYEIGNKGTVLNGALRYSIAGFINDIKNLQTQIVSLQSGGAQNLVNADKARIKGIDFDATWQMFPELLPGFVMKFAGSYLDAKYLSFPDGSGFSPLDGLFFGPGSLTLGPPRDFGGNDAVRTPKYSFTVGPNFATEVPGGMLEIGLDYSYNDGYYFDTQNTSKQPSYHLLNGRISYLFAPLDVRISVFGHNLTDEVYYINRFETDFATNSLYASPRTFGVTLSWNFHS